MTEHKHYSVVRFNIVLSSHQYRNCSSRQDHNCSFHVNQRWRIVSWATKFSQILTKNIDFLLRTCNSKYRVQSSFFSNPNVLIRIWADIQGVEPIRCWVLFSTLYHNTRHCGCHSFDLTSNRRQVGKIFMLEYVRIRNDFNMWLDQIIVFV